MTNWFVNVRKRYWTASNKSRGRPPVKKSEKKSAEQREVERSKKNEDGEDYCIMEKSD